MNAGAPTCPNCGGLNTNPQQMQCRFCGSALRPPQPPPGYGAYAPQPYGAPPPGYGYGPPPPGYGPNQVHGFGGNQPFQYAQPPVHYQQINQGWGNGWSTFFWVRLGIAVFAIGISLLGACVSALTH
jgi:hypothetical protein